MHYFVPKRCQSTSKIIYHDKARAQRAAEQSFLERGAELWVYRCRYCGGWHLTHRNPDDERMIHGLGTQRRPHSRKRGFKPRRR